MTTFYLFAMCRTCNSVNITKVALGGENKCFVCGEPLPLLNLMTKNEFKSFLNEVNNTAQNVLGEAKN